MNKIFWMFSVSLITFGLLLVGVLTPTQTYAEDDVAVSAVEDGVAKKTTKKKKVKKAKGKVTEKEDSEKVAESSVADENDAKVDTNVKKKKSKKASKKVKKATKADDADDADDAEKTDDAEKADDIKKVDDEATEDVTEQTNDVAKNPEDVSDAESPEVATISKSDASALTTPGEKAGDMRDIVVDGVKYTFCWCPAGTFQMGAPEDELGYTEAERLHKVELTGFWMLQSEVTQAMYTSIIGTNPSFFSTKGFGKEKGTVAGRTETDNFPVDRVSYGDAVAFCEKLSEICNVKFTLPTEAQWEYACRAGTSYSFYTDKAPTAQQANYKIGENAPESTDEVGKHGQNPWNLYDMMGNVDEWCADYYDPAYYANSPAKDPMGADSAENGERVLRGGSYANMAYYMRSATRNFMIEAAKGNCFDGFRFVTVVDEPRNDKEAKTAEEVETEDTTEQ